MKWRVSMPLDLLDAILTVGKVRYSSARKPIWLDWRMVFPQLLRRERSFGIQYFYT